VQGGSPYIGVYAVGGEIGVYAVSDYGTGVQALTYNGTAVEASTAVTQGYALRVEGAVRFSRGGRATVRGHGSGNRKRRRRAPREPTLLPRSSGTAWCFRGRRRARLGRRYGIAVPTKQVNSDTVVA
jgi:hypothetical protein